MEFEIKCFLNHSFKTGIFPVQICNAQKQIVYRGKTSPNGALKITLPYGLYTITVFSRWENICKTVFVSKFLNGNIPFPFSKPNTSSYFILTDQNYLNLPIHKGVITLWHNNIEFQLQMEKEVKK